MQNQKNTIEGISVIITVHDRKNFITKAVKSVLDQTIDKRFYEIIVIKNFTDKEIDSFLQEHGVRTALIRENPVILKHYLGIEMAKFEVIAFLDDDDTFHPQKLDRLFEVFSRIEGCDFYHNNRFYESEKYANFEVNRINDVVVFDNEQPDKCAFKRLLSQDPNYNLSSMALTKRLARKSKVLIENITREADPMWFLCALEFGSKIIADPLELTGYTRHSGGVSRSNDSLKVTKYANEALESYNSHFAGFHSPYAKRYLDYSILEWNIRKSVMNPNRTRKDMAVFLKQLLIQNKEVSPVKWKLVQVLIAIIFIFLPVASRQLYPHIYR